VAELSQMKHEAGDETTKSGRRKGTNPSYSDVTDILEFNCRASKITIQFLLGGGDFVSILLWLFIQF
jgi:hypothetical protein